jgi:hypothetical protein
VQAASARLHSKTADLSRREPVLPVRLSERIDPVRKKRESIRRQSPYTLLAAAGLIASGVPSGPFIKLYGIVLFNKREAKAPGGSIVSGVGHGLFAHPYALFSVYLAP